MSVLVFINCKRMKFSYLRCWNVECSVSETAVKCIILGLVALPWAFIGLNVPLISAKLFGLIHGYALTLGHSLWLGNFLLSVGCTKQLEAGYLVNEKEAGFWRISSGTWRRETFSRHMEDSISLRKSYTEFIRHVTNTVQ